jgi:ribosomal protein S18 acetylase RimI-like enzyme
MIYHPKNSRMEENYSRNYLYYPLMVTFDNKYLHSNISSVIHAIIGPINGSALLPLRQISINTFSETFAATNTPEDLQQYLDTAFATERLTSELENPESMFYLAWVEGQVAGYLKLNVGQAQTELQEPGGLEVERIYVLNNFQGKGVGQQLFATALAVAKERYAQYIWLGVWEHNVKAIRFYEQLGFVPFDQHVFVLGSDAQTDILMKKML